MGTNDLPGLGDLYAAYQEAYDREADERETRDNARISLLTDALLADPVKFGETWGEVGDDVLTGMDSALLELYHTEFGSQAQRVALDRLMTQIETLAQRCAEYRVLVRGTAA